MKVGSGAVNCFAATSFTLAAMALVRSETGKTTLSGRGVDRSGVSVSDLELAAPGFATSRAAKLELLLGEAEWIAIDLSLASVINAIINAIISAIAADANVEIVNAQIIDSRAVEDLSIRGRNFVEFVQLSPTRRVSAAHSDYNGLGTLAAPPPVHLQLHLRPVSRHTTGTQRPQWFTPEVSALKYPDSG